MFGECEKMEDTKIESIVVSWKVLDIEIHGTLTQPVSGIHFRELSPDKLTAACAAMSYNSAESELDRETTNTILSWLYKHHYSNFHL